jgi:hypothetical protein
MNRLDLGTCGGADALEAKRRPLGSTIQAGQATVCKYRRWRWIKPFVPDGDRHPRAAVNSAARVRYWRSHWLSRSCSQLKLVPAIEPAQLIPSLPAPFGPAEFLSIPIAEPFAPGELNLPVPLPEPFIPPVPIPRSHHAYSFQSIFACARLQALAASTRGKISRARKRRRR